MIGRKIERSIGSICLCIVTVTYAAVARAEQVTTSAGGELMRALHPAHIIGTIVYSLIGMVFFLLAFYIFNKIMPFSVRKEIEEDQNTSLGIIIGSFLIGLAIIIAAAIVG